MLSAMPQHRKEMLMPDRHQRDDAGEMASLPPELTELHRRLSADSARWLRTLPPSEGVADYARAMPQRMTATSNSSLNNAFSPRQEVSQDMKGHVPMSLPRHRLRLFLPVAATILIVALLAIAFAQFRAGHTQPGSPAHAPATQHDTGWVALPKLDVTTAIDANTPPAIAPTDPNVVYETLSSGRTLQGSTMRRTDDGGNTWHALPTPVPGDHIGFMSIAVSPANARTVFLSIVDEKPADCPADLIVPNTESNSQECWLTYYSADAGAHWTLLHFSFKGGTQLDNLYSQGNRLFASARCADSTCLQHIVMSVDGGKTWQTADAALNQGGNAILFFTAAGTSLFAVTCLDCGNSQATRSVWQSNDAGAHWVRNGTTPTPNVFGITATVESAGGNVLLYTSDPSTTSTATDKQGGTYPNYSALPGDLRVSADGGKTWESAPALGVPAGMKSGIGVAGPLQDGSVVVVFTPSNTQDGYQGGTLLAWKSGDSAWHQIAPPLTLNIDTLITTQSTATAQGTLWVITQNSGDHPGLPTFIFQKYTA
jgi:hypothetical protein